MSKGAAWEFMDAGAWSLQCAPRTARWDYYLNFVALSVIWKFQILELPHLGPRTTMHL